MKILVNNSGVLPQYVVYDTNNKFAFTPEISNATDFLNNSHIGMVQRILSDKFKTETEIKTVKLPTISTGNKQIGVTAYQLATFKYQLSIMAVGLKIRGVNLSAIKKELGLKGRSAKLCLEEIKSMQEEYNKQIENGLQYL